MNEHTIIVRIASNDKETDAFGLVVQAIADYVEKHEDFAPDGVHVTSLDGTLEALTTNGPVGDWLLDSLTNPERLVAAMVNQGILIQDDATGTYRLTKIATATKFPQRQHSS